MCRQAGTQLGPLALLLLVLVGAAPALAQDADRPITVFVFASDESTGNQEVDANLPEWAPEGLRFYFDATDAREVVEELSDRLREAVDRRRVQFADTLGRAEVRLEVVATRHAAPSGQRQTGDPVRLVRLALRDYGYSSDFLWGKLETPQGARLRVEAFDAPKEIARWISDNVEQLRE